MQILIRDLLFINYAVPLERVRSLVPERFKLDTRSGAGGDTRAFVSVVPFTIAEIRSAAWSFSFNQINYRVYVASEEGPAVYFLDLKVGSRTVAASANFFGLPLDYDAIKLVASRPSNGLGGPLMYSVESQAANGLTARVTVNGSGKETTDPEVTSEFITERTLGFITAASGNVYKIVVGHPPMKAVGAHVDHISVPLLESLGILNPNQSEHPHSVFYVEEAVFDADTPTKLPR